ncbi:hypothetical protein FRB97_009808 [Tulasnella sp. 331]|nr:hypothetical protein FRB97_009808 [Tulasnella sp. 331]KAG8887497.1 hypothetical protein FRB98_009513 [Tulasnella sp. 332]
MISLNKLLVLGIAVSCAAAHDFAQHPFGSKSEVHDQANVFPPTNHTQWTATVDGLSAVSSDDFSILEHPAFPEHSIRIKHVSDWCDPTVKSYTGYIDFQARHLFFYFFLSRDQPDIDPLLMWINGGPGGSSSIGLFMELGPCSVDPVTANKTIWNPYSWNSNASIFFLDQPAGVGYSYAEYGITISTTEEAARDVYAFIFLFLEHFKAFKGREFHLTGESYGGRYLPIFASEIVDNNPKAIKAGYEPINLKSVLIGNGWTDITTQMESYYDIQCTTTSYPAVQTIAACVRMKTILPRCNAMLQAECVNRFDLIGCTTAHEFCLTELGGPYYASGRNVYDISKMCEGDDLCYAIMPNISTYLNRDIVRQRLGVDKAVVSHSSIAYDVHERFVAAGDMLQVSKFYVAGLLERGVKVLIYVGDYDWICNWIGNKKWTELMEWTGQAAFVGQELKPWYVNGTAAGLTRGAKGLTFATVHAAGHMVPYDKPVQALELLNRWLKDGEL